LYNGGIRPFGYDSVLSELVPHKQQRKVVEFIFDCFLEAKPMSIVAQKCLEMGLRDRDNKPMDKRKVHKILNRWSLKANRDMLKPFLRIGKR